MKKKAQRQKSKPTGPNKVIKEVAFDPPVMNYEGNIKFEFN